MSTMEEMILAKLIDLARHPTPTDLANAKQHAALLGRDLDKAHKELAEWRKGEGPLTELWKAAEDLLKTLPPVMRKEPAMARMREAIKSAQPFVDLIPF